MKVCLEDVWVSQDCAVVGSGWDPNNPNAIGAWPLRSKLSVKTNRNECLGGEIYEVVAWVNVPHHPQWRHHTKREECEDISGEVLEFAFHFTEPEWEDMT